MLTKWTVVRRSLRFKLIIATVLVEIVMLALLVTNSVRSIENSLINLTRLRLTEVEHLLNTALASPLVEGDYATLQEALDKTRTREGILYLVLTDTAKHVVASSGWNPANPLPPLDTTSAALLSDRPFEATLPISIAGITYGTLRYGISTAFLAKAKTELLRESFLIAAIEISLSTVVLTLLGLWLTRHLRELTDASQAMAAGRIDIELPVKSDDEVGQLTRAFNTMASAIRERIDDISTSEAKFHAIADYTYGWESWYDPENNLIWVNPSVVRMTGYSIEECRAMPGFPFPMIIAEDRETAAREYRIATRGSTGTAEFRVRCKDGTTFWAAAGWQPIFSKQGEYLGIRSSIRDITDQKEAQVALQRNLVDLKSAEERQRQLLILAQQEQARMASLLNAMRLGILFETTDNRIAYHNHAFTHIWLIDEKLDLTGVPTTEVLNYSANILARPDHFSKRILQVAGTHEVSETVEVATADGRVVNQLCYPVRDGDGRFLGRLWIYEDVTRERQTAEQLLYLAERDSLTGLYNRRRFQDELGRTLENAMRRKSKSALLFFDLDEFKFINDTFGHRAGDSMLIRVAREVGALIRRGEIFSRLGGDEFAVLMPECNQHDAEALAERIIRGISQIPFRFEGKNLRLTTSIGIALFPEHASDQEELIAHADAAMYQAKEAGKNAWRVYRQDRDTSRQMIERLSWNNRIATAIGNGLLRLHFQGIYDAATGRLTHVEALVRMLDEELPDAIIMPSRFIPFAEKTGQILEIDRWVIREAIACIRDNVDFPPVPISVNISGRSFDDPSLPQYIADQLRAYDVPPGKLLVELTETSAVSDLHDAQRFIESLQQTGCRVCLDDFGSGFSSFTYIKHLKADILKIDGQFIRDLPNDHDNQIFVKAIVDVARGLNKKTIAEFVGDADTLEVLQTFGVDMVQGYYLSLPAAHPPAEYGLNYEQTRRGIG